MIMITEVKYLVIETLSHLTNCFHFQDASGFYDDNADYAVASAYQFQGLRTPINLLSNNRETDKYWCWENFSPYSLRQL